MKNVLQYFEKIFNFDIFSDFFEKLFFERFFQKNVVTFSLDRIFGQDFFPTTSPFDFLSIEHIFGRIGGL